jgi:hypothetical protein
MAKPGAFDLSATFVHLDRGAAAAAVPLTRRFWAELRRGKRRFRGRLMGVVRLAAHSDHWEAHPAGDELLLRLSGEMDVLLERRGRRRRVRLGARSPCCLVPRGVWHTIEVRRPGALLFVTPVAGTRRRPVA